MRKILMTTALGFTLSVSAWASNQDEKGFRENPFSTYNITQNRDSQFIKFKIEELELEIEKKKSPELKLLEEQVKTLQLLASSTQVQKDNFDIGLINGFPLILRALKDYKILDLDMFGISTPSLESDPFFENFLCVSLISYLTNNKTERFEMGQKNWYLRLRNTHNYQTKQTEQENIGDFLTQSILKAIDSKIYSDAKNLEKLGKDLNIFMKETCLQYEELRSEVATLKILLRQATSLDLLLEKTRALEIKKDLKQETKDEKTIEFIVTPETSLRRQILERTQAALNELTPVYDLVCEVIDLIKRSGRLS